MTKSLPSVRARYRTVASCTGMCRKFGLRIFGIRRSCLGASDVVTVRRQFLDVVASRVYAQI
jgi:hypothetical protein